MLRNSGQHISLRNLFPMLACVGGFCLSLTINYPGFMSYDSVEQILEARAGIYSDWHPPIMAFIWRLIERIVPGPFGMLFLQTVMIWSGTFLIARYWFTGLRNKEWLLAPCLLVFFPPVFGISGAIWKDIFMWASLILSIGFIGAIDHNIKQKSLIATICGMFFLFITLLFRHNAVFAVIPIIILGAIRYFGISSSLRRLFLLAMASLVALMGIMAASGYITNALTTYRTSSWTQLALFDIAGIIYHIDDPQQKQLLYNTIPSSARGEGSLNNLQSAYNPADNGSLIQKERPVFATDAFGLSDDQIILVKGPSMSNVDKSALMALWISSIRHYPAAWLHHRLAVSRLLIGLTLSELRCPIFMESNGYSDWVIQAYGAVNPTLSPAQLKVKAALEILAKTPLFRPWLYLMLCVGVITICGFYHTPETIEISLIAISGLAHELGLFLFAPVDDFRYSHYLIYTSMLALFLLIGTCFKSNIGKNGRTFNGSGTNLG